MKPSSLYETPSLWIFHFLYLTAWRPRRGNPVFNRMIELRPVDQFMHKPLLGMVFVERHRFSSIFFHFFPI
jgi:hypothetical protein